MIQNATVALQRTGKVVHILSTQLTFPLPLCKPYIEGMMMSVRMNGRWRASELAKWSMELGVHPGAFSSTEVNVCAACSTGFENSVGMVVSAEER